jgi:hypothetical protein
VNSVNLDKLICDFGLDYKKQGRGMFRGYAEQRRKEYGKKNKVLQGV